MPRPVNPDLTLPWKISMPATLAGRVEAMLMDPIHAKPIYSARGKLIVSLLEWWIAREQGLTGDAMPHVPRLNELRETS